MTPPSLRDLLHAPCPNCNSRYTIYEPGGWWRCGRCQARGDLHTRPWAVELVYVPESTPESLPVVAWYAP